MDLNESLKIINDSVVQGDLDDNSLILANKLYKEKTEFVENSKYNITKSLTLNQFLNTGETNQNLMKALVLGDTKIGSDGKTYIVVQTPSGKLDWRVKKDGNSTKNDLNSVFDNDDFPKDSSEFTVQNTNLGGSTGAKLVENKNGEKFVMKAGASKGHVEEEFLTNAIYKTMGFETPEMKLYEENGKSYLLSKFIPNATPFDKALSKGDVIAMESASEGFVLDCLLANWDAYQNDNILIDSNGIPVRVDNGGSLRYRAQGGLKQAFSNNVSELTTMINNNQWLNKFVTQDKINSQIEDIVKNEKQILDLIEDKGLKALMKSRIVFLKNRLPSKQGGNTKTKKNKKVDAYRELTEDELQTCYDSVGGRLRTIDHNGGEGWKFLSEVCKLRGFNNLPETIESSDFDKLVADKNNILVNRGLASGGGLTAKQCMLSYSEGDVCFYGTVGIHGAGIYAAINEQRRNDNSSPGYREALSYAYGDPNHIMDIIIPKEAKTVTKRKIKEMMQDEFFGPEFKEKKNEFDKAEKDYLQALTDLDKEKDKIEDRVKKELGWSQETLDFLIFERPEISWADTKKNPVKQVVSSVEKLVGEVSGTFTQVDDVNYEITLPNSSHKMLFNTYDFDDALKQKNENSPVYNYTLLKLKNFLINNHFNKIKDKIDDSIKTAIRTDVKLKQMKDKIDSDKKELDKIESEVNHLRKNGTTPSNKIIGSILKDGSSEMYGIYAAVKGYDAMIVEGGNQNGADFAVILNRNITKVRKFA